MILIKFAMWEIFLVFWGIITWNLIEHRFIWGLSSTLFGGKGSVEEL